VSIVVYYLRRKVVLTTNNSTTATTSDGEDAQLTIERRENLAAVDVGTASEDRVRR